MRILFIDDSLPVCEEYRAIANVHLAEHECEILIDFEDLKCLEDKRFDLAFIDWALENGKTGLDVIELIDCPVNVFVTGGWADPDLMGYSETHGIEVIPKPFHVDQIVSKVQEVSHWKFPRL